MRALRRLEVCSHAVSMGANSELDQESRCAVCKFKDWQVI